MAEKKDVKLYILVFYISKLDSYKVLFKSFYSLSILFCRDDITGNKQHLFQLAPLLAHDMFIFLNFSCRCKTLSCIRWNKMLKVLPVKEYRSPWVTNSFSFFKILLSETACVRADWRPQGLNSVCPLHRTRQWCMGSLAVTWSWISKWPMRWELMFSRWPKFIFAVNWLVDSLFWKVMLDVYVVFTAWFHASRFANKMMHFTSRPPFPSNFQIADWD